MENQDRFKLYGFCLDQIKFYNGISWQFPTALAGVNILALNYLKDNGIGILIISIINFSLLYSFYRHLVNFDDIVVATRKIEEDLSKDYDNMIPKFNPPRFFRSSWILLSTLLICNILLLIIFLIKIICPHYC